MRHWSAERVARAAGASLLAAGTASHGDPAAPSARSRRMSHAHANKVAIAKPVPSTTDEDSGLQPSFMRAASSTVHRKLV